MISLLRPSTTFQEVDREYLLNKVSEQNMT